MPITNTASYIPTMDEFLAHWQQCNTALGASPLIIAKPGGTATTRALFDAVRTQLLTAQTSVQSALNDQQIARGDINIQKAALLALFNQFTGMMEAYYQGTKFYNAKPLAPVVTEGQERFSRPMVDAMTLWEKMNAGAPPAGVTLPLTLAGGVDQGGFASSVATLQVAYSAEANAEQSAVLSRTERDSVQANAYDLMKAYRLAVPPRLAQHPNLIETLPKLTPEPGHTPDAVDASSSYIAPSTSHVVHEASSDPDLSHYELEGTNGDEFRGDDAVFLGRHEPNEANEFTVQFGLTQPGTAVALKVYVVLKSGNRAGSATMVVQRPAV